MKVHRFPPETLGIIFIGTLATLLMGGQTELLRLQDLARTQRELLMQSQLAPHFLFNSLGTLKNQIAEDPLEAQATADRLSRLFRELMDLGNQTSVPLGRELSFVEAYLGLEQARLGQRLQVHIEVPDELESLPVPPLSLQVLVENAIRHAIAPRIEGGLLTVRASRTPSGLLLTVTDPGNGTSLIQGTGRGLQVLRARLVHPSDLTFLTTATGHTASLLVRSA
jgi:LytS/YehU family sensor histidine kinase